MSTLAGFSRSDYGFSRNRIFGLTTQVFAWLRGNDGSLLLGNSSLRENRSSGLVNQNDWAAYRVNNAFFSM